MTDWLPIKTHPGDDAPVLVYGTYGAMIFPNQNIFQASYQRGWWAFGHVLSHVTHWRPLPEPPTIEPVDRIDRRFPNGITPQRTPFLDKILKATSGSSEAKLSGSPLTP